MRYLVLLLCLPSIAFGIDFVLRVDGQPAMTINAERVGQTISDGRILIDVIRAKPPSKPAPPNPPSDDKCGRVPANVTVVKTGSLTQRFQQSAYQPRPATVVAFQVTTPATGSYSGRATVTRSSSSPRSKLITVSKCPGDYKNPLVRSNACVSLGVEASQIILTTDVDQRFRCVLERNGVYYVNAASVSGLSSDEKSCTDAITCGFYFERDPS